MYHDGFVRGPSMARSMMCTHVRSASLMPFLLIHPVFFFVVLGHEPGLIGAPMCRAECGSCHAMANIAVSYSVDLA